MESFVSQLKDRRIWRVLIIYPSVTFALLQAIEFFINNYDLDARYLTAGIIVAVVLLPSAFVWNWRHGEVGEQAFIGIERATYAVSLIAAIVVAGWYWQVTPPQNNQPNVVEQEQVIRSIAVMPFQNAGDDADVQYLCDGIAEGLINWLASVPGVRVASKTASFRMRDQSLEIAELANAIGVDSVLRGRLEKVGEQIVVSAELVSANDDSQQWGQRLAQPRDEVLKLERSIVKALEASLKPEIGGLDEAIVAPGNTDNPVAYEHFLRGHYLIQSTNPESIEQGIEELRSAVRADPTFARPYADIADALSQMMLYGHLQSEELLGEARNAAYTAVALAPDLAESQTALATVMQYFDFDWATTDEAFEAAIALHPQSPAPYHRYTDYLVWTLRFDRAREMAQAAIEVDPLDSSSMHAVGLVELFDGNFEASAKAFGEWNRFHPGSRWSYVKHSLALSLAGQCDDALLQADKVLEMSGGQVSALTDSWLAWGYKVCNRETRYAASKANIEASQAAHPARQDPGYAYLLALEGDADAIADMYAQMVETRNPVTVFGQIFLIDYLGWGISGKMNDNVRFQALLDQVKFPPNAFQTRTTPVTGSD